MMKTVLLGVATVAVCVTSAMAARDDFDRADLGRKWVVPFGRLYINNNQLQGDTGSLGYDKKSSADSTVSATMYINSTDLEYGAVATGDIASGNNAFAKLQSQNGNGLFDHGALYVGNNGGGDFFQLDTPVASGSILTLTMCGTVGTMTIKAPDGSKQKYSYDYGTSFPTGGGLGTYGAISLDNYKSKTGGCAEAIGAKVLHGSTAKDPTLSK